MDKKLIIITLFILIYNTNIGQEITYIKGRIYYSNITINQVDTNKLKQGTWVYVFTKKRYYSIVNYKNDTITDTVKIFSFKNKLLNITMYENNLKNGVYYDYDDKGRVDEERHYIDDSLNGVYKIYLNGNIFCECFYKNDYRNYSKYYYKNGILESEYYNITVTIGQTKREFFLDYIYYKNGNLKTKSMSNINDNDFLISEEYLFRRDGSMKTKSVTYRRRKMINNKNNILIHEDKYLFKRNGSMETKSNVYILKYKRGKFKRKKYKRKN